jgi:phosphate transport system protein
MATDPLPVQLDKLAGVLGTMGRSAASAIRNATDALLAGRLRLAEQVIVQDAEIDALGAQADAIATEVLVLLAPVAGDLRAVVAGLRSTGNLERMGDLARHVAEAVVRHDPEPVVPDEIRDQVAVMGRVAFNLAIKASEVVRTRNVVLALELVSDDDEMNEMHRQLMSILMGPSWPHGVAAAAEAALLARFYERFADNAVEVARETVYAVTAKPPEELAPLLED